MWTHTAGGGAGMCGSAPAAACGTRAWRRRPGPPPPSGSQRAAGRAHLLKLQAQLCQQLLAPRGGAGQHDALLVQGSQVGQDHGCCAGEQGCWCLRGGGGADCMPRPFSHMVTASPGVAPWGAPPGPPGHPGAAAAVASGRGGAGGTAAARIAQERRDPPLTGSPGRSRGDQSRAAAKRVWTGRPGHGRLLPGPASPVASPLCSLTRIAAPSQSHNHACIR